MKHFGLYFWKEWREQRTALFALAFLLPVVVLAVAFALPARQVGRPFFTGAAGWIGLVTTLVVVGGELLSVERRTGGTWLERLPASRAGAFPAKLALHVLSAAFALAYGTLLGAGAAFLRGRGEQLLAAAPSEFDWVVGQLPVALGLAAWTFAASAWSPRGMIALGAGALVFGLLALPIWAHEGMGYRPAAWELPAAFALGLAGALASSWAGFVRGRRFVRGAGASATHGLSAGALCMLPLWGWSAFQLEERDGIDLTAPGCEFNTTWVTPDGRVVFLEVSRTLERWNGWRSHVLVVDLERGSWQSIAGPGATLSIIHDPDAGPLAEPGWLLVWSVPERLAFDPRSGEPLGDFGSDSKSDSDPESDGCKYITAAGHGWVCFDDEDSFVVDPYRGTETALRALGLSYASELRVGQDGWLLQDWPDWLEYVPETGELQPADWMASVFNLGPMLPDGRILAELRDATYGLVDLREDRIRTVAAPEFSGYLVASQRQAWRPDDPFLVDAGTERLLFDPECLELVPVDPSYEGRVLRALANGSILFLTDEGIVRRDAASGRRITLLSFTAPEGAP